MDKNMFKMLKINRMMIKEKVKRACAKQLKRFSRTENAQHW